MSRRYFIARAVSLIDGGSAGATGKAIKPLGGGRSMGAILYSRDKGGRAIESSLPATSGRPRD